MTNSDLNILVIDEDPGRATLVEESLVEAGYRKVSTLRTTKNLRSRIAALSPDMVIIDLQSPDRERLEGVLDFTRDVNKPVAMFVDQSDSEMTRKAVEAGVGAYVIDGLTPERVKAVVDIAITRFMTFSKVTAERDAARLALADRKKLEKAKGLLMTHHSLSEEEAWQVIRKAAMQKSRRMGDVAEGIIMAFDIDLIPDSARD